MCAYKSPDTNATCRGNKGAALRGGVKRRQALALAYIGMWTVPPNLMCAYKSPNMKTPRVVALQGQY
jgi:hypothetical protein